MRFRHCSASNAFAEGELDRNSNVQNMHIASSDKPVVLYSLDTNVCA